MKIKNVFAFIYTQNQYPNIVVKDPKTIMMLKKHNVCFSTYNKYYGM